MWRTLGFAVLSLLVACDGNQDCAPDGCGGFSDAARVDADPFLGNRPAHPAGQQGCLTGQKVAWVRIQDSPERLGKLVCVPEGPVFEGQACTFGPTGETTGYDDCYGGLVCSEGVCRDICYTLAEPGSIQACATGTCTLDPLLFRNGNDDTFWGVCR